MAATVNAAVREKLEAHFATRNAALPNNSPDRVSVYNAYIPGTPTNWYLVVYCGEPDRVNSTMDGLSRDADGGFQITAATSRPNSAGSPASTTDKLVDETLDALVDQTMSVTGLGPFTIQQDPVRTYPVAVEVVTDRVTVEQALLFTYLADRIG